MKALLVVDRVNEFATFTEVKSGIFTSTSSLPTQYLTGILYYSLLPKLCNRTL